MFLECIHTNKRSGAYVSSRQLPPTLLERIWNAPRQWLERARMRRELASLDPLIMRDAGLSAVDVEREADKPFWRR